MAGRHGNSMSILFAATKLGEIPLKNRIVMAPMTRSRADSDDAPTRLHVDYYRQRAAAGLIISEGVQPSIHGKGYCRTPGIYHRAHVQAWSRVTQAVRDAGGRMVMQLMHCGRVGHPANKAPGADTVAPSALRARAKIFVPGQGMVDMPAPRALREAEIPGVINEYRQATAYALDAGFDGIELHCTSGYLPAQFLATGTNQRSDAYGGTPEKRLRFVLELVQAMSAEAGAGRIGIRICPGNPFNDLQDEAPCDSFRALLQAIDPLGLAYVHVIRLDDGPCDNVALARQHFSGALIVNQGYQRQSAEAVIESGLAQAVSFARDFIANPDLPYRLQHNIPLSAYDPKTLYTEGPEGYTDYKGVNDKA